MPEPAASCLCSEIGPLLTAPGTSGRTWVCDTCGRRWVPGERTEPTPPEG